MNIWWTRFENSAVLWPQNKYFKSGLKQNIHIRYFVSVYAFFSIIRIEFAFNWYDEYITDRADIPL